jgi:hypothetical protein
MDSSIFGSSKEKEEKSGCKENLRATVAGFCSL